MHTPSDFFFLVLVATTFSAPLACQDAFLQSSQHDGGSGPLLFAFRICRAGKREFAIHTPFVARLLLGGVVLAKHAQHVEVLAPSFGCLLLEVLHGLLSSDHERESGVPVSPDPSRDLPSDGRIPGLV